MIKNTNDLKLNNKVLVVGGGIAGIKAALDISKIGKKVIVIESSTAIGGLLSELDRTFPTNNCDLCTLAPNISEKHRNSYIDFMSMTKIINLKKTDGIFNVELLTKPRYIDINLCNGCGICKKIFPDCVNYFPGLDHRAPTCMRYPKKVPQSFSINMDKCNDINLLVKSCPLGAILKKDYEKIINISVESIIIASGATSYNPKNLEYLGYGEIPDVITNIEYERMMSASGPTNGEIVKPSNGKTPHKISWIQCVGSRNVQKGTNSHCSGICCMIALKEAILTKEKFNKDIEITIFYMDMRVSGKGYESYYKRAKIEYDIKMIPSLPHSIIKKSNQKISINYVSDKDNSFLKSEDFDLVVLSTGLEPNNDLDKLCNTLDIELNKYGFIDSHDLNSVLTSKSDIYVCGNSQSPKDIPQTIMQASAAACMASSNKLNVDFTKTTEIKVNNKYNYSKDKPKIGVFICSCGENIGGLLDLLKISRHIKHLKYVIVSEVLNYSCDKKSIKHIKETIISKGLDRIVVGGCSPRTHRLIFKNVIEEAGLNGNMLEIANIREQNAWVHFNEHKKLEEKTIQLLSSAVSSIVHSRPVSDQIININKTVLVLGGGIAGMTSALQIANYGNKVFLVEKTSSLGGLSNLIHKTIEGESIQNFIKETISQVYKHKNIEVLTNAMFVDHNGSTGNFTTGIQIGMNMFYRQINHSATVIATGALINMPSLYMINKHPNIMTQMDLESKIESNNNLIKQLKTIVMIQCVDSRNENSGCSRICCQSALKNALKILNKNSKIRIFILYRDIRLEGFQECYYTEARKKGVIFVRYRLSSLPSISVSKQNQIIAKFIDPISKKYISVDTDALILSTGFKQNNETMEEVSSIFKLNRDEEGNFLESHTKLNPVAFSKPGFFMAGTCHGPKSIRESITQAYSAAINVQIMLTQKQLIVSNMSAIVNKDTCASCLMCVRVCPYSIPFINIDGYSEINSFECHGCGICVSECPANAIELNCLKENEIMAKIKEIVKRKIL